MSSYQNKSSFYLFILLIGSLLFGISIPTGIIMEIIIPGFFPNGEFSMAITSSWDQTLKIGVIVGFSLVVLFTIFAFTTAIGVIREFIRRRN